MTYTRHGHHIPGTPGDNDLPTIIAKCGGPNMCVQCYSDAVARLGNNFPVFNNWGPTNAQPSQDDGVDLLARAKGVVITYYNDRAEKTDQLFLTADDVYIVWWTKTLQNWKALVSTTIPDWLYYEITHNGDKNETYLDVFKKIDNVVLRPRPSSEKMGD